MNSIFTFLHKHFHNSNPARTRNKYVLVFLVFGLWLAFFDKNRWISQWQLQRTIYKYENEKEAIREDMKRLQSEAKDLNTDLEKFGREEYLMTKNDEDLFIIAED